MSREKAPINLAEERKARIQAIIVKLANRSKERKKLLKSIQVLHAAAEEAHAPADL